MWLRVKTKRKLFFCYIYIFLLLCTCIRVVHTFMYVRVLNVFNYMCTIYHAVKPCTPPVPPPSKPQRLCTRVFLPRHWKILRVHPLFIQKVSLNYTQTLLHGTVTPSSVTVLYREGGTNESVRYRRRSTYT